LGYNPTNNSLFLAGHTYNQWVAEISIPTLVNSTDINSLNTASIRQNFADLSAGHRNDMEPVNGCKLGGIIMNGTKLVISDYAYYDGNYSANLTHFEANANWTANGVGFSGLKRVDIPGSIQAGFIGGYMANIPAAWQSQLGGSALTGKADIPIIARTSLGPAAFSFVPSQVAAASGTIPANPLIYYDQYNNHWRFYLQSTGTWSYNTAAWSVNNDFSDMASMVNGVVFPEKSRTILFFGRDGDTTCYGDVPPCVDPANQDHGFHGYPYHYKVWAYDANDLLAVKNGAKEPWEIVPYAMWSPSLPFYGQEHIVAGVAYDPATQRIYLAVDHGEGNLPVIHVYQVNVTGGTSDATAPAAPTGLRVQ
jgi:hypothetical protein